MTKTNRFVSEKATAGRFVSLVVAYLQPSGVMTIVDAGHGHWIHRSRDSLFSPAQAGGAPIGIDPNAQYTAQERDLELGDRLVLYTDGITEQENSDSEPFGADRLSAVIACSEEAHADVEDAFTALLAHAGGRAIEDDATIASIERIR